MKIGIWFSIFILSFAFMALGDNFTGTPTSYRVTVNKAELYNSSTSSWVTVGSGDMTFDIASVTAGQAVGNYIDTAIPAGVYTQIRVTISRTMQIQGSAAHGGSTYYTTTTQQSVGTGGQAVVANTTGPAALGTMVVPSDNLPSGMTVSGTYFIITETLSSSFTVTPGIAKKISIDFDVTGSLTFNHDNPTAVSWPTAPTTTFSVE